MYSTTIFACRGACDLRPTASGPHLPTHFKYSRTTSCSIHTFCSLSIRRSVDVNKLKPVRVRTCVHKAVVRCCCSRPWILGGVFETMNESSVCRLYLALCVWPRMAAHALRVTCEHLTVQGSKYVIIKERYYSRLGERHETGIWIGVRYGRARSYVRSGAGRGQPMLSRVLLQ